MAKEVRAPERVEPGKEHPRQALWLGVREALLALPAYFTAPDIRIAGVRATEVFTLAAALGATIEDQVVATLNRMREVWDPDDAYRPYSFVRQPQTFPDVLLMRPREEGRDIALGIELKGWYLLAKEEEPTFRYKATPAVSTQLDLLVVVPWFLGDVISGTPKVLRPFIESARYAAEYRNWWWKHKREARGSPEIRTPADVTPYPPSGDRILDEAVDDAGNNFGRLSRSGLLDDYMKERLDEQIAGIEARYWLKFFLMFRERADPVRVAAALERMAREHQRGKRDPAQERATELVRQVTELLAQED